MAFNIKAKCFSERVSCSRKQPHARRCSPPWLSSSASVWGGRGAGETTRKLQRERHARTPTARARTHMHMRSLCPVGQGLPRAAGAVCCYACYARLDTPCRGRGRSSTHIPRPSCRACHGRQCSPRRSTRMNYFHALPRPDAAQINHLARSPARSPVRSSLSDRLRVYIPFRGPRVLAAAAVPRAGARSITSLGRR